MVSALFCSASIGEELNELNIEYLCQLLPTLTQLVERITALEEENLIESGEEILNEANERTKCQSGAGSDSKSDERIESQSEEGINSQSRETIAGQLDERIDIQSIEQILEDVLVTANDLVSIGQEVRWWLM